MQGELIKIISDTHFVKANDQVFECKCRGKFRNQKITPLVGDRVLFSKEDKWITEVLPRKNELSRPPVANIDQGFLITSVKQPDFSLNLLDKLIVLMELSKVKPILCITKMDLLEDEEQKQIKKILAYYKKIGYPVYFNYEYAKLKRLFKGKTSVFTGQTGAGKSTLLNRLAPLLSLKTGEISLALGRGKHTTRHVELIELFGGKVLDTPGFSALDFHTYTKEDIKSSFVEFGNYTCKYHDCMHLKEDHCAVKEALLKGEILPSRYENYQKLVEEVESVR